jgi:hypothetical protein
MLRILRIATLVLMAVCLVVGASIALADTGTAPAAEQRKVEAVRPITDNSLAAIAPNDISDQDI